jgi:molybdopterin synthase catalytic subunit
MIRVQNEDFDPGVELARFAAGNHAVGGVCAFVGLVRDEAPRGEGGRDESGESKGAGIGAMTLEHYPGMTQRELERIEAEARRRWPLEETLIIHRYGRLLPGDRIVLVATASPHRKAAFESCEFLIDWLKTKAPFWKKEETAGGERWVVAREADDAAAERWRKGQAAE